MTANEILDVLERERHTGEGWHFFRELRMGVGNAKQSEFRLDGWAMTTWEARGLERITYEVKVARSDWRKELATPVKRRMGLMLSHRFYFVAPPGLVKIEEVPPECGLIEILPEPVELKDPLHELTRTFLHLEERTGKTMTRCRIVVEAPKRDSIPFTWTFAAMLIRRIVDAGEIGRLTKLNHDLMDQAQRFEYDATRAKREAAEAREALSVLEGDPETLEGEQGLAQWLAGWGTLHQLPRDPECRKGGAYYDEQRELTSARLILGHAKDARPPGKATRYARNLLLDLAARAFQAGRQAERNEGQLAHSLEAGLS